MEAIKMIASLAGEEVFIGECHAARARILVKKELGAWKDGKILLSILKVHDSLLASNPEAARGPLDDGNVSKQEMERRLAWFRQFMEKSSRALTDGANPRLVEKVSPGVWKVMANSANVGPSRDDASWAEELARCAALPEGVVQEYFADDVDLTGDQVLEDIWETPPDVSAVFGPRYRDYLGDGLRADPALDTVANLIKLFGEDGKAMGWDGGWDEEDVPLRDGEDVPQPVETVLTPPGLLAQLRRERMRFDGQSPVPYQYDDAEQLGVKVISLSTVPGAAHVRAEAQAELDRIDKHYHGIQHVREWRGKDAAGNELVLNEREFWDYVKAIPEDKANEPLGFRLFVNGEDYNPEPSDINDPAYQEAHANDTEMSLLESLLMEDALRRNEEDAMSDAEDVAAALKEGD